ncbi:MAG: ketopantoate reductase family protein [Candidatus Heimdallarchaeota archaeon]
MISNEWANGAMNRPSVNGKLSNLRVVVVGVGAIGGPIAAHLVENGIETVAVTKYPELAETIQKNGLQLHGVDEETRSVRMVAVPLVEDLDGHFDIAFLAMKANGVQEAVKALQPFLRADSVGVTLQNGIVEDLVAEILGRSRVIGAAVGWASTMTEPGVIHKTSIGDFTIGLLDEDGNHQRLAEVETLLGYCQSVVVSPNIYGALYSKLTINACITGVGAVCGQTFGEMLSTQRTRRLFMGITTEAVAVAFRLGIKYESIGGFEIQRVALTEGESEASIAEKHAMLEVVGQVIKDGRSSSLQSLERGRPTEIGYLNGYIATQGIELGIATPINSEVTRLVKEIEAGQRSITPENLLELPLP